MNKLDENKAYYLGDLNEEQAGELFDYIKTVGVNNGWNSKEYFISEDAYRGYPLYFNGNNWNWTCKESKNTTNAIELFYTLENIQVDCKGLSKEQIEEMANVFLKDGYEYLENKEFALGQSIEWNYLRKSNTQPYKLLVIQTMDENKTTITYEKFMELFGTKELKKENKPSQYNMTKEEIFNPQKHYDNSKGSLYKLADELKLNHWEFDILKRLVRCRKKGQLVEDLNKIKDTIDIYIREYNK